MADLKRMRRIILNSGALDYARKEISELTRKAEGLSKHSRMRKDYLDSINSYAKKLLLA